MPIHLIWGDDYEACNREIQEIVQKFIDPTWKNFNQSQLDGNDPKQNFGALEEIQSAPFGNGSRVVIVRRSPFCNGCPIQLANKLEQTLKIIPENTHLILYNSNKPDKRLKTTKLILEYISLNHLSKEKSFTLPLPWDINGQRKLVANIAIKLNLKINAQSIDLLVERIGNDSTLISSELKKLALLSEAYHSKENKNQPQEITQEIIHKLIEDHSTNSLEIANLIIKEDNITALSKIKILIDNGEPPLRLISTLTGQSRGWVWVKLLDEQGNQDIKEIAKLAGIANPKRIFIIRKQIQGKSTEILIQLMKKLLTIEAEIKLGSKPIDSFKDNLLTESKFLTNS